MLEESDGCKLAAMDSLSTFNQMLDESVGSMGAHSSLRVLHISYIAGQLQCRQFQGSEYCSSAARRPGWKAEPNCACAGLAVNTRKKRWWDAFMTSARLYPMQAPGPT